jgi:hypothetical protein
VRHGRLTRLPSRTTLATAGGLSVAVAIGSLALGAVAGPPVPPIAVEGGPGAGETPGVAPSTPPSNAPVGSSQPGGSGRPSPSAPPGVPVIGGPLPSDLAPALARARDDRPVIYRDGCHLSVTALDAGACAYGDPNAATTVVLFGDSHAAQWFPTLERLALEQGWRLVSLTKSSCPSVDVAVWVASVKREYRECEAWRERAFERIGREAPALVVVANSRVATLLVDGTRVDATEATEAWNAGLRQTLERVRQVGADVLVIGDTPRAAVDPPACLSRHPDDVLACATETAMAVDRSWLAGEAGVAAAAGARFLDPTDLLCSPDACPAVIGRYLVQRDEHHLATPFAASLADRLGDVIAGSLP